MRERKNVTDLLVIDLKWHRVAPFEEIHFTSRKNERNPLRFGFIASVFLTQRKSITNQVARCFVSHTAINNSGKH